MSGLGGRLEDRPEGEVVDRQFATAAGIAPRRASRAPASDPVRAAASPPPPAGRPGRRALPALRRRGRRRRGRSRAPWPREQPRGRRGPRPLARRLPLAPCGAIRRTRAPPRPLVPRAGAGPPERGTHRQRRASAQASAHAPASLAEVALASPLMSLGSSLPLSSMSLSGPSKGPRPPAGTGDLRPRLGR